jgi:hypothetical protein
MSTTEPIKLPRKKLSIYWWLGGIVLLLLTLFLYQLFGPNPKVIVSPQTTYVTTPLKKNGLPDYEQFYRDLLSAGVTPENNAAPLLYQALGPGDLKPDDAIAIANELGLAEIPTKDGALTAVYSSANRHRIAVWLDQQGRLKWGNAEAVNPDALKEVLTPDKRALSDEAERVMDGIVDPEIDRISEKPWTNDQLPPMAEWLAANQKNIDLIVAATKRPRYYSPSPSLLDDQDDDLISVVLPQIQPQREAARALRVRAMWNLGNGKPQEAWQDILAIHHLAVLMTQDGTLVAQLVADAIEGIACAATVTYLEEAKLSPAEFQKVKHDLDTLPHFAQTGTFDKGERLMGLDVVVNCAQRGGVLPSDDADLAPTVTLFNVTSVDWNVVLSDFNVAYDQLAAVAAIPDPRQRRKALKSFEASFILAPGEAYAPSRVLGALFSRQRRSQFVSGILADLMLPAANAAMDAQDRTNAQLDLTRVAAALAIYHAEHGSYPKTLADLGGAAVAALPLDPFTQQAFVYVPQDSGYLLYSRGINGVDDGGSNANTSIFEGYSLEDLQKLTPPQAPTIPTGADDFSIRVPRLPTKLPK